MSTVTEEGESAQETIAIGISFGNSFSSIAYTTPVSLSPPTNHPESHQTLTIE